MEPEDDIIDDPTEDSNDLVAAECLVCKKLNFVEREASGYECMQCGEYYEFHICLNRDYCGRTFVATGANVNAPKIRCPYCKQSGKQSSFPLTEVIPVELDVLYSFYKLNGLDPDHAIKYPERTVVEGTIVSTEGLSGLAAGEALIEFNDGVVLVMLGTRENVRIVPFSDVKSLRFSGPGSVTKAFTKGGGFFGGGFGNVSSMGEGMLLAEALNKLSTKTTSVTTIETLVSLEWNGGGVVVRNSKLAPRDLSEQFRCVLDRLDSMKADKVPSPSTSIKSVPELDLAGQISRLEELRREGVLTDEEFKTAKSRVLNL